eukprot:4914100-Lingulodinium_polyedra.AAC.1
MVDIAAELVEPQDIPFFEQRVMNSVVRMTDEIGEGFDFVPKEGALMGTSDAPVFFVYNFQA